MRISVRHGIGFFRSCLQLVAGYWEKLAAHVDRIVETARLGCQEDDIETDLTPIILFFEHAHAWNSGARHPL